jgi:hypothetical protein
MNIPAIILGAKIYHLPDTTTYYLWLSNYDRVTLTPLESDDAYFISNSLKITIQNSIPQEYYTGIQRDLPLDL